MLVHLSDQMRHTLGDARAAPRPGPLRWPLFRHVAMFWLPWPHGRAKGPPEAFLTRPTTWAADLTTFETLIERFVEQENRTDWPEHALFGPSQAALALRKRRQSNQLRRLDRETAQDGVTEPQS